jgi:predicted transposase YbfD/YdcC
VVITADALHTQQEHARQIIAAGGHYLFIAKGNQPTLHRRLKTLPWREAVLNDRTDETGHGRREIRRMKICTARPSRSNAAAPTTAPARPPSSRSTPSPASHQAASPTPSSPP